MLLVLNNWALFASLDDAAIDMGLLLKERICFQRTPTEKGDIISRVAFLVSIPITLILFITGIWQWLIYYASSSKLHPSFCKMQGIWAFNRINMVLVIQ